MTQIIVDLKLAPDELQRRLALLPDAFFYREAGVAFCGAFAAQSSHELEPTEGGVGCGRAADSTLEVPQWVGVLPYESFRGLERSTPIRGDRRAPTSWSQPIWKRFPAIARLEAGRTQVVGETRGAVQTLVGALRGGTIVRGDQARLRWAAPPERAELHRARILSALEAIGRGELYQVNLARRFEFEAEGSVFELLSALQLRGPAPFGAALQWGPHRLVSLSPELFIHAEASGLVRTRPIKGTRPRSGDHALDEQSEFELEASEKERAELTMVVDLERNDLGKIAEVGSVRLSFPPRVVRYPSVLHREAEVEARLPRGTSWSALLQATCPSGSVTGAPKVSAMDLIAQLEAHRRGLYTGALGYVSNRGTLRLSMAIRNLIFEGGRALYYSGGGIVADSDPVQEVEETLWKAEQLSSLVELAPAGS